MNGNNGGRLHASHIKKQFKTKTMTTLDNYPEVSKFVAYLSRISGTWTVREIFNTLRDTITISLDSMGSSSGYITFTNTEELFTSGKTKITTSISKNELIYARVNAALNTTTAKQLYLQWATDVDLEFMITIEIYNGELNTDITPTP